MARVEGEKREESGDSQRMESKIEYSPSKGRTLISWFRLVLFGSALLTPAVQGLGS